MRGELVDDIDTDRAAAAEAGDVFSAYVLLFLSFIKEYSSAVFLFSPGSEIIGTTMLSFWANGDSGPVAALSVIQLAITVLFVLIARLFLKGHQDV
jgi:iron(III) transport system permease protein